MTTSEARRQLKEHEFSDRQAEGMVDVWERWEQARAVSKDHLDARLAQLQAELLQFKVDLIERMDAQHADVLGKLHQQTAWIVGSLVLGVLANHFWR